MGWSVEAQVVGTKYKLWVYSGERKGRMFDLGSVFSYTQGSILCLRVR